MRLDVEYLNPFFTRRLTQEVSLPHFLEEEKLVELVVALSTTQGSLCSHTTYVGTWDICVLLMHRETSCNEQLLWKSAGWIISELPQLNLVYGFVELAFNHVENHEGHPESPAASRKSCCHSGRVFKVLSHRVPASYCQWSWDFWSCDVAAVSALETGTSIAPFTFQAVHWVPRLWGCGCKTTPDWMCNATLSGSKL